jgi:hypothetical protein
MNVREPARSYQDELRLLDVCGIRGAHSNSDHQQQDGRQSPGLENHS